MALGRQPYLRIPFMEQALSPSHPAPENRPGVTASGKRVARLVSSIWAKELAQGLLLACAFLLYLGLLQFSTPDLAGNDGYYHIKLAYLMRTEGLKPDFPYLPLTILNAREFYDHHFLFHVAMIPFTIGDLRTGAKLATVVFAALAFLATWNLLKNQRVRYALLWSVGLLAISEAFLYRMSIPRAQSLSLAFLMLGLDWLLRRKYRRLAILSALYVWLYNAFPLILLMAVAYLAAVWLADRELDLKPLVYIGVGTALGLVFNPYFPYNLVFAAQHILPKLSDPTAVRVGSEWYPYDTSQLLENSPLALAAFVIGSLGLGLQGRIADRRVLTALLLAAMFGLLLFQSRRFVEYYPAFALVFAALAWSPVLERYRAERSDRPPVARSNRLSSRLRRAAAAQLPAVLLAAAFLAGLWTTFGASRASLASTKPYETYAGASAWLEANTPAGARVFQTDWDDFPRLFFYNTHNTYLVGLDPTYMQLYDEELYELWVDITQGDVERPSAVIQDIFGASYVVTDLRHTAFLSEAKDDARLAEVYRDDHSAIFQVFPDSAPN